MNELETGQLLYHAAYSQALALGFRLGDGADTDLKQEAVNAAKLIFGSVRSNDRRDDDIARAVQSFRTIVDRMIAVRFDVYGGDTVMLQSRVIGENTLARVRQTFCPGFWPFC